jgi:putative FmdB family regulatory protein
MPLYEFRCPACEAEFTELLRRHDPGALAAVACPECGRREVVRKISTFAANVRPTGSGAGASAASCAPGG